MSFERIPVAETCLCGGALVSTVHPFCQSCFDRLPREYRREIMAAYKGGKGERSPRYQRAVRVAIECIQNDDFRAPEPGRE